MAFKRKPRPLHAPDLTPDEALAKLEHFCAYRDRCSSEVREKMAELRLSKPLSETLFDTLKADRFFDDERFAEIFARGKFRGNQWGRVRIRMELKMRQIDPATIEQALDLLDEEEYLETLEKLLVKKLRQWTDDPQVRQKAAAALIRSGFEPDLVFQRVNRLPSI